jgi:hypothetical protein
VCDRQHPDLLVAGQVANVVRETANSGLAEDKVIADIRYESSRIRPTNNYRDGIFDGSQEGEAESVAPILIPKGRFSKLGDCFRCEADPASHPASSSASR